jgi:hypothetical protein
MRAMHALLLAAALAVPAASFAQDRAKPREREKKQDGDRRRRPEAREAPERRHPRPEAQPREERRRNDGDRRRDRAVPRDPDGRDDARDRHPRPDPDRHWRERRYSHRDYRGIWGHDRHDHRDHYWFPRHYRDPWRFSGRYHGLRFYRHTRFWCPEFRVYFYWPFLDEPAYGCDWYWVPTYRTLEWTPHGYRYRYWGWQHVYLCFD